jgi:hypothetical protein
VVCKGGGGDEHKARTRGEELNLTAGQRELITRDRSFNNTLTNNFTSSSRSTIPITQSGAIHPAVARYNKFQLTHDYMPLTEYTTGFNQKEMLQAEQDQGQAEKIQAEQNQGQQEQMQPICQADPLQQTDESGQAEMSRAELNYKAKLKGSKLNKTQANLRRPKPNKIKANPDRCSPQAKLNQCSQ